MKKAGYSPEYAAAIEACASTGSDTMPPVMGGLVFIMVIIFGVDYGDVVLAALLPSLLFYFGLLVQVDAYAARRGLKAAPDTSLPAWWRVLLSGWSYLAGLAVLVFGLVYMRWGAITPIYAALAVLLLQMLEGGLRLVRQRPAGGLRVSFREGLRSTSRRAETGLAQTAGLVNYAAAIFIGMGFIMVGLLKTGVAAGLAGWIVSAGGHNLYLVLFVCFIFSLIMGLAELQRTAYILLAVIAVPAIMAISKGLPEFAATGGLPLIGLNLFFIFYAALGGITPPVALHAFVAASIAEAEPMKTSWLACRLGVVLFFLPFFFVLQPALLIIYTPWWQTLLHLAQAAAGIFLLSSALEGYLLRIGILNRRQRLALFAGGFMLAFPLPAVLAAGLVISAVTIGFSFIKKSKPIPGLDEVVLTAPVPPAALDRESI
jgi:TRAP transporter 4TM/12TM fusion protein